MESVELFVGAGGLALGVSQANFKHALVVDFDRQSCDTIRENKERGVKHVRDWPLRQADVRHLDYAGLPESIDLLAGGPPCQPFSLGGKHRAHRDKRDMFPEVARAIRTIRPRAIIIENVRGLVRRGFAKYFSHIILQLTYPEIEPRDGESWTDHLARLERYHTAGCPDGLFYRVVFRVLNAADYGVPQLRERVVIVGFRSDLGIEFSFPSPTHSRDALLSDQFSTRHYWERHQIAKRDRPEPSASERPHSKRPCESSMPFLKPWRTVRDAFVDLPDPFDPRAETRGISNHRLMPGARPYPGHTGSRMDWPAKTLKAGVHGVPGGENMVVLEDGSVRYFTVREAARLQTFPDDYYFPGVWSENMRQLGNAVPVQLGEAVAKRVRAKLARALS